MNQSQFNNESDCSYLTMNTGIEERYPPTNSFMSIVPTKYKITKKGKKGISHHIWKRQSKFVVSPDAAH